MTPGDRIKYFRTSCLNLSLEKFARNLNDSERQALSVLIQKIKKKTDRTPVSLFLYLSFFFICHFSLILIMLLLLLHLRQLLLLMKLL